MAEINTGDMVRISAVFQNTAGVATDPTTITLTIVANGVSTVLTFPTGIVKDSIGNYHYDYPIATGESVVEVVYRWAGTGAVTAAEEGHFFAVSRI